MAKRFTCWVIVAGQTPTAFRARQKEDLLPTLRQLQHSQPDTTLKWFERGRLWNSPDDAREDLRARRTVKTKSRGPEWRPGGAHADPRARYKLTRDEKRARFRKRRTRPGGPAKRRSGPR